MPDRPDLNSHPGRSPFLRSPLPGVNASSDDLRQFYLGGQIPQTRLIPPAQSLGAATSTGTGTSTTIVQTVDGITVPVDAVLKDPSSDQVVQSFNLLPGTDLTQSFGSALFRWNASLGTSTVRKLNNVRFAAQFQGADLSYQVQAAIADLGTSAGWVILPENDASSSFTWTQCVTLAYNGQHIIGPAGGGKEACHITFNPADPTKPMIQVKRASGDIFETSVGGFTVRGENYGISSTGKHKIGLQLVAASECYVHDVVFALQGRLAADGVTDLGPSIGLQIQGHEFITVERLTSFCDRPISIEGNPVTPVITLDHASFRDLYLAAQNATENCINVADNTYLTSIRFDGIAFVAGKNGFVWDNPTASGNSIGVAFRNVRFEQEASDNGWAFYINCPNSGVRGFHIADCIAGRKNFLYGRGIIDGLAETVIFEGDPTYGIAAALDLDFLTTVAKRTFRWVNCTWLSGATMSLANGILGETGPSSWPDAAPHDGYYVNLNSDRLKHVGSLQVNFSEPSLSVYYPLRTTWGYAAGPTASNYGLGVSFVETPIGGSANPLGALIALRENSAASWYTDLSLRARTVNSPGTDETGLTEILKLQGSDKSANFAADVNVVGGISAASFPITNNSLGVYYPVRETYRYAVGPTGSNYGIGTSYTETPIGGATNTLASFVALRENSATSWYSDLSVRLNTANSPAANETALTEVLGISGQTKLATFAGTINSTGYQVSGVALAASNLSNGTTGSGNVVLATNPTLSGAGMGAGQLLHVDLLQSYSATGTLFGFRDSGGAARCTISWDGAAVTLAIGSGVIQVGGSNGINASQTFKDGSGATKTMTVTGGVITGIA